MLLAYTAFRSYVLFNRINPDISKKGLMRDLNLEGPFQPQTSGFDFSFGIGKPLDPSYGYYTAVERLAYFSAVPNPDGTFNKTKETRNIELVQCGSEGNFHYSNQSEVVMLNINKYMCFNRTNLTL